MYLKSLRNRLQIRFCHRRREWDLVAWFQFRISPRWARKEALSSSEIRHPNLIVRTISDSSHHQLRSSTLPDVSLSLVAVGFVSDSWNDEPRKLFTFVGWTLFIPGFRGSSVDTSISTFNDTFVDPESVGVGRCREWRNSGQHFVNKNSQRPIIDCLSVSTMLDNLRSQVFYKSKQWISI